MRVRLKLRPGQRGAKKLSKEYGEQLVCVRYRYDEARRKRYKTVELIVDEVDWQPANQLSDTSIECPPKELEKAIQQRNGIKKIWDFPYQQNIAVQLVEPVGPVPLSEIELHPG